MQVESEIYNTRHVAAQALQVPVSAPHSDPNPSNSLPIANFPSGSNPIDSYLSNQPRIPHSFSKAESHAGHLADYPRELVQSRPIIKNYISHFCSDCHKGSKAPKKLRRDSFNELEAPISKFEEIKGFKRKSRVDQTSLEEAGKKRRLELIKKCLGYDDSVAMEEKSCSDIRTKDGKKKRFAREAEKEHRKQSIAVSSNNASKVTQKPPTFHKVASKSELPAVVTPTEAAIPLFPPQTKGDEPVIPKEPVEVVLPPPILLEPVKQVAKETTEPKAGIPIAVPNAEPKASEPAKIDLGLFARKETPKPLFGPEMPVFAPQKTELPAETKKEEPVKVASEPAFSLPPLSLPKLPAAPQEAKPLFGTQPQKEPLTLLFTKNAQPATPELTVPSVFEAPKVSTHTDTPMPSMATDPAKEPNPTFTGKQNPFMTFEKAPQLSDVISAANKKSDIFGNLPILSSPSKPLFGNPQSALPSALPEAPKEDSFKQSPDSFKQSPPSPLAATTLLVPPSQSLFSNTPSNTQIPSLFSGQLPQTNLFSGQAAGQPTSVKNLFGNDVSQQPPQTTSFFNQPTGQQLPSLFGGIGGAPSLFGKPAN